MDLKNTFTRDSYCVVAASNGGFVAHSDNPALETVEGPTLEDVERQILTRIEAADAQNPLGKSGKFEIRRHTTISKFSYHIEEKLEGGFIARPSDPNMEVIEGVTREGVKQEVQEKMRALLGEQRIPNDSTGLGEINIAISRKASFSFVRNGEGLPSANALNANPGDGNAPRTFTLNISNPGRIVRVLLALAVLAVLAYFYYFYHR